MHKKFTLIFVKLIFIFWIILMIMGCSDHHNPLRQSSPRQVAQFLVKASLFAEKRLSNQKDNGYSYYDCMEGINDPKFCQALYEQMKIYAEKYKIFKKITDSDLADSENWKNVKSDYESIVFNLAV